MHLNDAPADWLIAVAHKWVGNIDLPAAGAGPAAGVEAAACTAGPRG